MNKFYVLRKFPSGSPNYDRGWLLSLHPQTEKECRDAIAWHVCWGYEAADYIIVTAAPRPLAGVMEYLVDGVTRPVLLERGPFMDKVFVDFCMTTWGDARWAAAAAQGDSA